MKNRFSLLLLLLAGWNSFSQEGTVDTASVKKPEIKRWSVDFALGSSHGIRPYTDGYFSSEGDKFLGELNLNSITFGGRYYLNKFVTFKADLAFDRFTPQDNKSLDFDVAQFRLSLQTMFNLNSVFGIKETSKFKLLTHVGLNVSSLKTIKTTSDQTIGSPDYFGGFVYGLAPMYGIGKKASLFLDVSIFNNYRQHHTWDGHVSNERNNLSGQMTNISLGINYKLGKRQ